MRLSRVIIMGWGIAMLALSVAHAAPLSSSADVVPPPLPPGGPMSHHFGPPPPPPPSKAAFFHFHRGDIDIDIKCADEESLKTCAEASNTLLDKAFAAIH